MSGRGVLAGVAAAVALAGCGGGSEAGAGGEVQDIFGDLESLRPGEILIKGLEAPRVSGPYDLKPGGYVLTFEQTVTSAAKPRLVVVLESEPNAAGEPEALVVETTRATGKADVTASGRLYVNVRSAGAPFVLRFTPKRR